MELAIQIVCVRLEANQRSSQFFDQPENALRKPARRGPEKRDNLYFTLSVVWLVILAGGLAYLWFW